MNPADKGLSEEQWRAVWQLYEAAADLPMSEARSLIHSTGSDAAVIGEVLSLLDAGSGEIAAFLPAAPATRAGEEIGPYVVLKKLGSGLLGETWSGRNTDGQIVALRFLKQAPAQFGPAGEIVAVNHPNIASVCDVIDRERDIVVAIEWVDGVSLETLRRTKVPVDQTIHIARQVARALAAAHAQGFVHGSLRPGSLIVRPDGLVKVLDFGLSARVAAPPDDVFALGLLLYELLTGSLPPEIALRGGNVQAPSAFNPLVPLEVDRLIASMLLRNAAQRPPAKQVAELRLVLDPVRTPNAVLNHRKTRRKALFVAGTLIAGGMALWFPIKQAGPRAEPVMHALTDNPSEDRVTAAAISPDGKLLAFASLGGIFIRLIANGDTRPLSAPPNIQADRLVWFPDGSRLLMGGFAAATNRPSLWSVPISGDSPSLLRQEFQAATPSPDGSQIAFTSSDGKEIWISGSNGESARRVFGSNMDTFPMVLWSPDGRRLAYQRRHYAPQPLPHEEAAPARETDYERSYESFDLASGKAVASVPNIWMSAATALSDGRIVFARRESQENYAVYNLWVVQTDPKTGAFARAPRRITSRVGDQIIAVSAPARGGRLVLVIQTSQADVYVGELEQPGPRLLNVRRLTLDQRDDFPHSWTADSKSVIFESNRNGNWDIFKQTVGDRSAKVLQASPLTEYMARLTPDGESILYCAYKTSDGPVPQELFRLPLQGGISKRVRTVGPFSDFRCSGAAGKRCVLRSVEDRQQVFHELDPVLGKGRELLRVEWYPGLRQDWDLSPDGRELAIERWDSEEARIRRIRLNPNEAAERLPDVIVSGWSRVGDLNYSADGQGWFVSAEAPVGATLLYADIQGTARVLQRLDYGSWAVPSPDGSRLAFSDRVMLSNTWMIDKF